jgi:hypothetical protein
MDRAETRSIPTPDTRLHIGFGESASALVDVSTVMSAIEAMVSAAGWIELCTPELNSAPRIQQAREHLRHAILHHHGSADAELVRAALFAGQADVRTPRRSRPGLRRRGRDDLWGLTAQASPGPWFRRELALLPEAHTALLGWAVVDRLAHQSPINMEVGYAKGGISMAAGAVGVALVGPAAAPLFFFGFARAVIALWTELSKARTEHAHANAAAASGRAEEARARLAESVYKTTQTQLSGMQLSKEVVDVAIQMAIAGTLDIATGTAVADIRLTQNP